MDIKVVILIIIILILFFIVLKYSITDANTLNGSLQNGKAAQEIKASQIVKTESGQSSVNFTYSIWFYIDNWNYRYGQEKCIFTRSKIVDNNLVNPCPYISLSEIENNLNIYLTTYDTNVELGTYNIFNCGVSNIPLQKWTNLLFSVYGRVLDVYIDGKLVRTCIMPNTAFVDNTFDLYITPAGGFDGWTSKLQYWTNATEPQKAWNIYKQGYGGGGILDNITDYNIKLSILESNIEKKSFVF